MWGWRNPRAHRRSCRNGTLRDFGTVNAPTIFQVTRKRGGDKASTGLVNTSLRVQVLSHLAKQLGKNTIANTELALAA